MVIAQYIWYGGWWAFIGIVAALLILWIVVALVGISGVRLDHVDGRVDEEIGRHDPTGESSREKYHRRLPTPRSRR
jgi:hypothetical protein